MTAMRVEAGRGWGWIVEGWRLFAQAPGIWIVILLIYLGLSVVMAFIPFVGGLAQALLAPVLVGGMMYGAAAQERGEPLEIGHLFQGFKNQERMGPLVVLGLISLGGYVVMGLVIVMVVGGSVFVGTALHGADSGIPPEAAGGMLVGAGLVAALVVTVIGFLIVSLLFYGIPLVMLAGQNAWPAAQASIAACWINVLPLLVFGVLYLVLAVVAAIPFGLGFLVLGPVTICAVYASYRDVFGDLPARINLAK